ncbi:NUDIX domain-containing protein [Algoriphagus sp.]|uniref:NUDIX domain-containing protein n=1 Tax=Algoriphagus sp. TaxID=1872435 RepID=UPI00391C56D1
MTENPWKTLGITNIYENPWIKLEHHDIVNPAGKDGIYSIVHFKNLAIGIIPIDKEGNTWIVGQYRYALKEYSWEIPMGGGLIGIDTLESAQRELKEETGLQAKKWTNILKIHTSNSVTDEAGYVFLAENLTEGETEFEETEVLQIKKLPFQAVLNMVMSGEITDSLSIAGILKAARILGY